MCKCTPNIRKPFCGKPGCEWPKQLKSVEQEENELICERLLGWERWAPSDERAVDLIFRRPFVIGGVQHGYISERARTFTDWAGAGLILEALTERGLMPHLYCTTKLWACTTIENALVHLYRDTGPLAIRAAALAHIRSLP